MRAVSSLIVICRVLQVDALAAPPEGTSPRTAPMTVLALPSDPGVAGKFLPPLGLEVKVEAAAASSRQQTAAGNRFCHRITTSLRTGALFPAWSFMK
jgi:hypothetical protein